LLARFDAAEAGDNRYATKNPAMSGTGASSHNMEKESCIDDTSTCWRSMMAHLGD
jgi:hypothetical protein